MAENLFKISKFNELNNIKVEVKKAEHSIHYVLKQEKIESEVLNFFITGIDSQNTLYYLVIDTYLPIEEYLKLEIGKRFEYDLRIDYMKINDEFIYDGIIKANIVRYLEKKFLIDLYFILEDYSGTIQIDFNLDDV